MADERHSAAAGGKVRIDKRRRSKSQSSNLKRGPKTQSQSSLLIRSLEMLFAESRETDAGNEFNEVKNR